MTNTFLQTLEALLHTIPERERKEMLYDYEEHFQIGTEKGKDVKELVEELGDPYVIARDLLADYHGQQLDDKQIKRRGWLGQLTVGFGLFLLNGIFVVAPIATWLALILTVWGIAIAFALSPLILLTSSFLGYSYESFVTNLFASLALGSAGILLGIAALYLSKFFYRTMKKYGKFTARVIKGGVAL